MGAEMTHKQRVSLGLCAYPGCGVEPMADNNECRYHRAYAADRKRYWWHFRRHARRPVQLAWGF